MCSMSSAPHPNWDGLLGQGRNFAVSGMHETCHSPSKAGRTRDLGRGRSEAAGWMRLVRYRRMVVPALGSPAAVRPAAVLSTGITANFPRSIGPAGSVPSRWYIYHDALCLSLNNVLDAKYCHYCVGGWELAPASSICNSEMQSRDQ